MTGIHRANSVGGWHLRLEGVVEMKRDAVLEFTVYLVVHDVGVAQVEIVPSERLNKSELI